MIIGKNTKFLIVLLIGFMSITSACKTSENIPEEAQEAHNAELQAQKEAEQEYELALKHHYEIQSKQTKEGTKLLKKRQKKVNKSKKRSFWDRLFNNNCSNAPVTADS